MPQLLIENVVVPASPQLREEYNRFKRNKVLDLKNQHAVITADLAVTLYTKLRQFAAGAIIDTDSGSTVDVHTEKLDALDRLINSTSDNILVAYFFKSDVDRIKSRFPDAVVYDSKNSVEIETEWNNGNIPLLLINPASAGMGLNLQDGGHTFIWYTLPTSLMHYQQANARLYRQGQKNMVTIYHLVMDLDIERRLLTSLENKGNVQDEIMDYIRIS